MIRHLLRLVWNRKRSNALVITEIFFSFLVMFGVATMALHLWTNARRSLGFDWQLVWLVSVDMGEGGEAGEVQSRTVQQLLREVRALAPVEAIAASVVSPYANSTWMTGFSLGKRQVNAELSHVSVGFDRVFGLHLVAGRWFHEGDDRQNWRPVVIDQDLAREVFGAADPLGKVLHKPEPGEAEERVIGVVSDFRKEGDLAARRNFLFYTLPAEGAWTIQPNFLLVRVRPGTTVAFERELIRRMQALAPGWSFTAKPLAELRKAYFRRTLTPILLGSTVALFLLVMVGLGLIGVLWQGVLRRTRELGLRRAIGASRGAVLRQIVFEQLLLTTLGVLLGALVAAQLPLIPAFSFVDPKTLAGGLLSATVLLYLLALVCALYPSSLAGRLQPADALRYE